MTGPGPSPLPPADGRAYVVSIMKLAQGHLAARDLREDRCVDGDGAVGTLAVGALAIGALAIGALAIGRLAIRRAMIGQLQIAIARGARASRRAAARRRDRRQRLAAPARRRRAPRDSSLTGRAARSWYVFFVKPKPTLDILCDVLTWRWPGSSAPR